MKIWTVTMTVRTYDRVTAEEIEANFAKWTAMIYDNITIEPFVDGPDVDPVTGDERITTDENGEPL